MSPSTMLSSTPVILIVWGVFQFASVKVSVLVPLKVVPLSEPSVASLPVVETVTSAVGSASRTTGYVEGQAAYVGRSLR